jgi:L-cysteine:1D-myo-inositol 2-amino-2-deoxy-alpha-D-glucopyranoside ligase
VRLFNTLTRRVEELRAQREVSLYVCGVTPYDTTHVGHARTYLVFDVLVRCLLAEGHRVHYVQNITDVDDSILRRAAELRVPYEELQERYTGVYMDDVAALGMVPAMEYPRATSGIAEMQEVIRRLIARGHAYEVDGDVFFRVSSGARFGELSKLDRAGMLEIEAQQDAPTLHDPRKEDALDFPLWKSWRPGEPRWDSPWGQGRPGWHIECSTLVLKHLGPQVDIHGGGSDLIYPHHESEIVQSEAVTGVRPFARHWMHVGMVRLDGQKMSKSDGNLVFVTELLGRYSADALRLYLLTTHYRRPLDFDERRIARSARLAAGIARAARGPAPRAGDGEVDASAARAEFEGALREDLDTPGAIRSLAGLAAVITQASASRSATFAAQRTLRLMASRIGLQLAEHEPLEAE